jgi:hypothetical protein
VPGKDCATGAWGDGPDLGRSPAWQMVSRKRNGDKSLSKEHIHRFAFALAQSQQADGELVGYPKRAPPDDAIKAPTP